MENKKIFTIIKTSDLNECKYGNILRVYSFFDNKILDETYFKITKVVRKFGLEISINNFKSRDKYTIEFLLNEFDSIINPPKNMTDKRLVDGSIEAMLERYKKGK